MKTKAQKLMENVKNSMTKDNIPAMLIFADSERMKVGVLMDDRKEAYNLNKAILLDAMTNVNTNLFNLVFDAVATIIALSPTDELREKFEKYVKMVKESDKENKNIIKNTAEA
jgi:hypothetical protein